MSNRLRAEQAQTLFDWLMQQPGQSARAKQVCQMFGWTSTHLFGVLDAGEFSGLLFAEHREIVPTTRKIGGMMRNISVAVVSIMAIPPGTVGIGGEE